MGTLFLYTLSKQKKKLFSDVENLNNNRTKKINSETILDKL